MGRHGKPVLLVFPSQFSMARIDKLIAVIKDGLRSKDVEIRDIVLEEECIVYELSNVVEGASIIGEMFGIDKVAIAKKMSTSSFEQVIAEVVNVGKLKILPNEKFFVQVQISNNAKVNYKPRDLEFASTGELTAVLQSSLSSQESSSSLSSYARPARDELDADRLIEIFVGKKSTYVCIEVDAGLGGLPFACQGQKVLCTIHNTLSAISCMAVIKAGFLPEIVILYTDDDDLRQNLKIFGQIVNRMNTKKYLIRLAKIEEQKQKQKPQQKQQRQRLLQQENRHKTILQEITATQVLTQMSGKTVIVSLSAAIHPLWLIESIFKKILSSNKIPWMPLLLPAQGIYDIARDLCMDEHKLRLLSDQSSTIDKLLTFTKEDYAKYMKRVNVMTESALKNMKTISFEIGPNYLHDILDSI